MVGVKYDDAENCDGFKPLHAVVQTSGYLLHSILFCSLYIVLFFRLLAVTIFLFQHILFSCGILLSWDTVLLSLLPWVRPVDVM